MVLSIPDDLRSRWTVRDVVVIALVTVFYGVLYVRTRTRSATGVGAYIARVPEGDCSEGPAIEEKPLGNDTRRVRAPNPLYGPKAMRPQGGRLPEPDPLSDFDPSHASLRDYVYANRTLRYPYFQTMAHQPMHVNDWIEIDSDYAWYLDEKAQVIAEHGTKVLDSLPENDDACAELLATLVEHLPQRFPTLFSRLPPPGCGIWNRVTDERFSATDGLRGVDALRVVSRLVQDDFLMARERPDGQVYLVGGLLAFPGSYLLSEHIGKPLHALHAAVPHFAEKILRSVARTLVRFPPDRPFERSSWMVVDDRNLFWHNIASNPLRETQRPEDLFLRIDHQTFRKLPRTGGIVFGIHPVLKRMGDLADTPLVPALLAKMHTESDEALLKYKGAPKYSALLLPYLEQCTRSQIARGLVLDEDLEDVATFRELAGRVHTEST
ncbi:predicted protein [Sparassis crispa]|uniref:Uncharacterized protein n=1 Tax=Sparassis crispa TaxID=139825 RepID=A0A401GF85_9APHY|nr:predicted protein [Sparassis crispa]GBE80763.1 predicted protein [Sparassis crispa]